jgi:hypothetical protein
MIDGDMTTESNGKVLGFNEGFLSHIVRKYFYKIPPHLPLLKRGEILAPFRKEKKYYPPFGKGGRGGI